MEFTIDLIREVSFNSLYHQHQDLWDDLIGYVYNMALDGKIDLVILKDDLGEEKFWVAVKMFRLKGFDVTITATKAIISWEELR